MAKKGKTSRGRSGANGSAALTVITERQAWFTPETLAAYLQVSDRQGRNWGSEGLLASYKIGSFRRFYPADVDAFVAQFRGEGKPGGEVRAKASRGRRLKKPRPRARAR